MRVKVIATLDIGEGFLDKSVDFCLIELGVPKTLEYATASTLARVGGQKDLDLRLREHDGADIATLCDNVAGCGKMALASTERLSHVRIG